MLLKKNAETVLFFKAMIFQINSLILPASPLKKQNTVE